MAVIFSHNDQLPDVVHVHPVRHGDARGWFQETWSERDWQDAGLAPRFVQDNQSFSAASGTLRGLHYQTPPFAQAKLVRCLRGAILDVVVDIRRGSPTYGRHIAVTLTSADGHQLFVPEGFAHGFCTLTPDTEIAYKVTAPYAPESDRGIAFDDRALAINWPVSRREAVLSDKDAAWPVLAEAEPAFSYSGVRAPA